MIAALKDYWINVSIFDPWANPVEVKHEYGLTCHSELVSESKFDAVVLGVAHNEFLNLDSNYFLNKKSVLYNVKGVLQNSVDGKL